MVKSLSQSVNREVTLGSDFLTLICPKPDDWRSMRMGRFAGNCWKCGTVWSGDSQPGRSACCEKCDFDLHSCLNCKHHDVRYNNECRIPESDVVTDRDRSNFCELFEIKSAQSKAAEVDPVEKARKKLDNLFGG